MKCAQFGFEHLHGRDVDLINRAERPAIMNMGRTGYYLNYNGQVGLLVDVDQGAAGGSGGSNVGGGGGVRAYVDFLRDQGRQRGQPEASVGAGSLVFTHLKGQVQAHVSDVMYGMLAALSCTGILP
jgi:hypothetical protein